MPKVSAKRKYSFDRDEVFDIICFYVGQGDCSLIRCPDGKVIMIDCGSTDNFPASFLKIVADQVRDPDWAGASMKIDTLILTHKDVDHHNKVVSALGNTKIEIDTTSISYKKLVIDQIYFSWSADLNAPLRYYGGAALNENVYSHFFATSELREVTINSATASDNFYRRWVKKDNFKNALENPATKKTEWPLTSSKMLIYSGVTPTGGKNWSVSLIAGNVLKVSGNITDLGKDENGNTIFRDGAKEDNARSLVTLLEIDGAKALFCGDATYSTEQFLVNTQAGYIKNAQFILAPHHGSEWASSPLFVDTVNPKQVAVSAAYQEHKHKHPRATAMKRWIKKARLAKNHEVDYWNIDSKAANDTLADWKKRGLKFLTSPSGNFFWLTELSSADINYGIKNGKGVLYRAEIDGDLQETAFQIIPDKPDAPGQFLNYQLG